MKRRGTTERKLLHDPSTNRCGIVEQPLWSGPFPHDVLGIVFLHLEDDDRQSLMAISQVCHYWRWVSNLLPQGVTALYPLIPEHGMKPRVRDECLSQLRAKVEAAQVRNRQAITDYEARLDEAVKEKYIAELNKWQMTCENFVYVWLALFGLVTFVLWVVAMAGNVEWSVDRDEKNKLRWYLSRLNGFLGLCEHFSDHCYPMREII